MTWWQKLRKNPLAQVGAFILLVFYLTVFWGQSSPRLTILTSRHRRFAAAADRGVLAQSRRRASSLVPMCIPPPRGQCLETGDREVFVDFEQPSPIRLFVQGDEYRWLRVVLPLPTQFSFSEPGFQEVELFGRYSGKPPSVRYGGSRSMAYFRARMSKLATS
jgi:peptide/nickel transport system permease protein